MYVLVREDEAEQHKRELKNSIEPQIHQLLKLANEYGAEQEDLEIQLREQVCAIPSNPSSTLLVGSYHPLSTVHRVKFVSKRHVSSSLYKLKVKGCPKGSEPLREGRSFCDNTEIGSKPRTRSRRKFWLS